MITLWLWPAAALADGHFDDWRVGAAIQLGYGFTDPVGHTVTGTFDASAFVPLFAGFGVRTQVSLMAEYAAHAGLISFSAGPDYTLSLDRQWGLGLSAGGGYAPWGFLEEDSERAPIRGAVTFQELSLRQVLETNLWTLGARADQLFAASGVRILNFGFFFRFSFLL